MSDATKFQLYRLASFASLVVAGLCLSRMSPWASPRHNKIVFALLIVDIIIGLYAVLCYYYYRAKLQNSDTGRVGVQTLASAGKLKAQQQKAAKAARSRNVER
ncbi:MAG TPA: hypothetical protein VFL85_00950 [Candidatus Saccharimonadales bacterium]|nr:hypothetical protein [Candidatus Saccharimonadales bacterium]